MIFVERARFAGLAARLQRDRRAAIALITAFATPVLLMSVAMGIEIGHWSDVKLQLQRTADLAALAGAKSYAAGASAEAAANVAANVAEFNAGIGGATRSWTAASETLSDSQIIVQITKGVNNPADPAVRVTVTRAVPMMFSRIAFGGSSVTMNATSLAEVGTTVNTVQPCILTLNGGTTGAVAVPGTTLNGNVQVELNGCSVVSDGNTNLNGHVTLDASAIYAAGGITTNGSVSGTAAVSANQYPNSPPVSDPYASDAALQNAIAQASCSPAIQPMASNGTINLYPNTCYGSISVTGRDAVVFNGTGLYTVNGSFSVAGTSGATISGSGITLTTTGAISVTGNFSTGGVTLTAATVATTANGAIPGVLFATSGTAGITFSGNAAIPFSGLVYGPNSAISLSGNATDGSNGCSEVISRTLTISGNMNLAANCSNYGLLNYGSLPNTTTIGLVQ